MQRPHLLTLCHTLKSQLIICENKMFPYLGKTGNKTATLASLVIVITSGSSGWTKKLGGRKSGLPWPQNLTLDKWKKMDG